MRLRRSRGALSLARRGLVVFARPRYGSTAIASQLFAWALQWLACYVVLLALGLQHKAGLAAAAAILLAVNVSAVLPATPSNVGVFQAACLVVLAAYGVGGGPALAYGIILQAVEVLTALALGIPALLGEGLTWREIRAESRAEQEREAELTAAPAIVLCPTRRRRSASASRRQPASARSDWRSELRRLQHGGRLVAAVGHAVFAARVLAAPVLAPVGRLEQLFVGLGVAVGHQVARALPAEQRVARECPTRCSRIRPCPRGSRGTAGCGSGATSCAGRRRTPP